MLFALRGSILNKRKEFLLVAMAEGNLHDRKIRPFQADFPLIIGNPNLKNQSISLISGSRKWWNRNRSNSFDLLRKRKHSISHQRIPDPEDHAEFVTIILIGSGGWFLEKRVIGAAYLTKENALGIQLTADEPKSYQAVIEKIRSENHPLPAIPSVRPGFLYACPPDNRSLSKHFELGAKQTQVRFDYLKDFSKSSLRATGSIFTKQ